VNIHPKVTVIIPVYNVAAYLPQCLDSVIAQTLDDIEIICVNDGSKDESLAVLNEYAAQDSRIKIIDKANAGVSAARNDGIAAAQGEYIAFLDGDDFLEPDCLEKVYATAVSGNFDTVVFKHNLIDGNKKTVWNNSEFGCFDEDKLLYTFSAVIWNKLYRTAFLREKQIGFPLGLKIAEDTIFSLMCFFHHPVCGFCDGHFYNYRLNRDNSATADKHRCIYGETAAYQYLEQTDVFQRQPRNIQLKIAEKFLSGIEGHINRFSLHDSKEFMKVRKDFIKHLQGIYGAKAVRKLSHLKQPNLLQKIFSIKNSYDKKYKVITFFGIKFQLKRHKKS